MECILRNVRLSFPDIWRPGNPGKDSAGNVIPGKYGCQGIIDQNDPDRNYGTVNEPRMTNAFKEAQRIFTAVAMDKWKGNGLVVARALPKDKKCIRAGNQNLDNAGNIRDGYQDKFYIACRNKAKPAVVHAKLIDKKFVYLTEADGKPYGGCFVNLKVDIYAMDKPGQGKSINATLLAVQFLADGPAFGAAPGTADGFGEEAYEETTGANEDALFGGQSFADPFGDSPAADNDPFGTGGAATDPNNPF